MADNPGLSGWTQHSHKGSWKKGEGGSEWEKEVSWRKQRFEMIQEEATGQGM